jgi:dolichol-phosphate mannosyltransferase
MCGEFGFTAIPVVNNGFVRPVSSGNPMKRRDDGSNSPRIVCILPAFNEEGKIGRVVEKVSATGAVDRIVAVDDCSTDNTRKEAAEAGAHVIRHDVNMGVGAGIRSGLMYGRENGFDIAVIMSGDDQHDPKELPRVLRPLIHGEAHFIQGSRRLPGGGTVNAPVFREVTTRLYSRVFSILTGKKITDATNGFRAFLLSILDDDSIDIRQQWLNTYELEPYLLYRVVRSPKFKVVEAPITIFYRGSSRQYSKMKPFRDWWRLLRPLILLKLHLRR